MFIIVILYSLLKCVHYFFGYIVYKTYKKRIFNSFYNQYEYLNMHFFVIIRALFTHMIVNRTIHYRRWILNSSKSLTAQSP